MFRKRIRTKQTARKSTGGKAPRTNPNEIRKSIAMQCRYKNSSKEEELVEANGMEIFRGIESHLSPAVKKKLKRVKYWDDYYVDATVYEAMQSRSVRKCKVLKSEGTEDVFTLVATDKIMPGECIGVLSGELWEEEAFMRFVGDDESPEHYTYTFFIAPSEISPKYKGPGLVIYFGRKANELKFLQDCAWVNCLRKDEALVTNVKFDLYWDYQKKWPIAICTAISTIEKGKELFVDWGPEVWKHISVRNMNSQGYVSHRAHLYCAALEELLKENDILTNYKLDEYYHKKDIVHNSLEMKYVDMASLGKGKYTNEQSKVTVDPSKAFKVIENEKAFASSDCRYRTTMKVKISDEVQRKLNSYAKTQPYQVIQSSPALLELLESGTAPKCNVREVHSLVHPVRWFTPPNFPAYALVATATIPEGDYISLYIGTLTEDVDCSLTSTGQVYTYAIKLDNFNGPSFAVDNQKRGNEARYINDCFCREGGTETINAEVEIVWDNSKNIPHIALKATKDITQDDEIVCSYGNKFWLTAAKCIMIEQAFYADYMQRRIAWLEIQCMENNLVLPRMTTNEELLQMKLFKRGDVDYKDLKKIDQENEEDEDREEDSSSEEEED